jgi:hypothetical protein
MDNSVYFAMGFLWTLFSVGITTAAAIYFIYRGVREHLRDWRMGQLPGVAFKVTPKEREELFGRRD